MSKSFLLELGTEEIPARFMPPALAQLKETALRELSAHRLSFDSLTAVGTPRRLTLYVSGLAGKQDDLLEKKKGPAAKAAFGPDGTATAAAAGFARSQGVDVGRLCIETVDGVEYVFAERHVPGLPAEEILAALCVTLIKRLTFPKPMFWFQRDIRFARPIRWVTALFGNDVVEFEFAGLSSGRVTYGHRFLAPAAVVLGEAGEYLEAMEQSFVIVDPVRRRQIIAEQVSAAAAELGGKSEIDEELLDEVTYLVEYPRAVTGSFSGDFLEIPPEVLITVMRIHQRYFPVFNAAGKLLPHFITISNGTRSEYAGNVRAGNEKVLRARLADARFFYDEDKSKPFSGYVEELDKIVFMEQLGSMRQKTERLVRLCEEITKELKLPDIAGAAARAAYLAKADLVTHMVYEFPELQGTMGRYYALLSGEKEDVAVAVGEHYAPRFAGDQVAVSTAGAILALADKTDTLAACFGLGLIPSGSQDPYALRRSALGIVSTLKSHNFSISLRRLAKLGLAALAGKLPRRDEEVIPEIHEFLLQRVRYIFAEEGLRYDIIEAVLGSVADDLPGLWSRARVLQAKLDSPELTNLLTPFTRASNLAREAGAAEPNPELMRLSAEQNLYRTLRSAEEQVNRAAASGDYSTVFAALSGLQEPIDNFFTDVMVMVEDTGLRANRLALLNSVRKAFLVLGDLSRVVCEKK